MRLRVHGEFTPSHLRRAPSGGLAHFQGGQYVSREVWDRERARAKEEMTPILDTFGENLQFLRRVYEQNVAIAQENKSKVALLPLPLIEGRIQGTIRETYAQAFLLGKRAAGNFFGPTEAEREALEQLRQDEFHYLKQFLGDIQHQSGVMDYMTRMDYYRASAREAFWLGWVMGNKDPKRRIAWITSPRKEHCADCARFAAHGPYTMEAFLQEVVGEGFLPQSGRLACIGYHCGCSLEEV